MPTFQELSFSDEAMQAMLGYAMEVRFILHYSLASLSFSLTVRVSLPFPLAHGPLFSLLHFSLSDSFFYSRSFSRHRPSTPNICCFGWIASNSATLMGLKKISSTTPMWVSINLFIYLFIYRSIHLSGCPGPSIYQFVLINLKIKKKKHHRASGASMLTARQSCTSTSLQMWSMLRARSWHRWTLHRVCVCAEVKRRRRKKGRQEKIERTKERRKKEQSESESGDLIFCLSNISFLLFFLFFFFSFFCIYFLSLAQKICSTTCKSWSRERSRRRFCLAFTPAMPAASFCRKFWNFLFKFSPKFPCSPLTLKPRLFFFSSSSFLLRFFFSTVSQRKQKRSWIWQFHVVQNTPSVFGCDCEFWQA